VGRRVLDGLRDELAPDAIAKAVDLHREAAAAEPLEILASRAPIERELAEIAGHPRGLWEPTRPWWRDCMR